MSRTKLSVNINKIATLRNARGGDVPNLIRAALDCEHYGAEGITVHPRPDERHVRYQDVRELHKVLATEFNIEGNPCDAFMGLVLETRPDQVTLVPDADDAITSNAGWDTITYSQKLAPIIQTLHNSGIRCSIFVDPSIEMVEGAAAIGADRVELYTQSYATLFEDNPPLAIAPYLQAARRAQELGLGINAGHDLSARNLRYFVEQIPFIDEVSIGHALISEALYDGLEHTIATYLACLK